MRSASLFRLGSGILLLLMLTSVNAESIEATSVSPKEAASLANTQKAIILDVREDDEWREQHIPNALHIPLGQLSNKLNELAAYKNTTIITQCRSGRRSAQAQQFLLSAGFTQVVNLAGGLIDWSAQGLPTQ